MHLACATLHRRCQDSVQASRTDGADAGKSTCTVVHGAARCRRCLSHLGDGARLESCTVGDAMVHPAPCVPWPCTIPYPEALNPNANRRSAG